MAAGRAGRERVPAAGGQVPLPHTRSGQRGAHTRASSPHSRPPRHCLGPGGNPHTHTHKNQNNPNYRHGSNHPAGPQYSQGRCRPICPPTGRSRPGDRHHGDGWGRPGSGGRRVGLPESSQVSLPARLASRSSPEGTDTPQRGFSRVCVCPRARHALRFTPRRDGDIPRRGSDGSRAGGARLCSYRTSTSPQISQLSHPWGGGRASGLRSASVRPRSPTPGRHGG